MSEREINEIIAKNLTHYLTCSGKNQVDLANHMGVSQAAVSDWCTGNKLPRMNKFDKICAFLSIERSDLMEDTQLSQKAIKDISEILDQTREQLLSQEGLMFDGDPASPEAIDSILSAMQVGMEMAKLKNKEKYTPKKYKKD